MYVTDIIEKTAIGFLRELGRHRTEDDEKTNPVMRDEHGEVRKVMGGIFNATGGRDVKLSMAGLTAHDIAVFRKDLKAKTGITLSQEMADQLLQEASYATMSSVKAETTQEDRREKMRERKAKRRQWARENGLCVICCKEPAADRADGTTGTTCKGCQQKANEAKKRHAKTA